MRTHIRILGVLVAGAALLFSGAAPVAARPHHHAPRTSVISGTVAPGGWNFTVKIPGKASAPVNQKTGFFVLKGKSLGGKQTLVFVQHGHRRASSRHQFMLTVNVPKGGHVTLDDVTFGTDGNADAQGEEVGAEGVLTSVDCTAAPNTMVVTGDDGNTYSVGFDPATTQIYNAQDATQLTACADLAALAGQPVAFEAMQNADGSLTATEIVVNPGSGDHENDDIEFGGTIQSTNCPSSIVVTREDGTTITVTLTDQTEIRIAGQSDGSAPTCTNFSVGDHVRVKGKLQPDGTVIADEIGDLLNLFEAFGMIDTTDCSANPPSFSFTPGGATTPLTVTIGATTVINVNGNESATCADLSAGPAGVLGVMQQDGSVAAHRVEQESPGDGDGGADAGCPDDHD
jgi:hypothetical protein